MRFDFYQRGETVATCLYPGTKPLSLGSQKGRLCASKKLKCLLLVVYCRIWSEWPQKSVMPPPQVWACWDSENGLIWFFLKCDTMRWIMMDELPAPPQYERYGSGCHMASFGVCGGDVVLSSCPYTHWNNSEQHSGVNHDDSPILSIASHSQ